MFTRPHPFKGSIINIGPNVGFQKYEHRAMQLEVLGASACAVWLLIFLSRSFKLLRQALI